MDYLRTFSNFIETITGINQEYVFLLTLSIITFLIIKLISYFLKKIFEMLGGKKGYVYYQRSNLVLNIICIVIVFIIWDSYLDNIITVITFVSAALTLALRDFVFNFFAGIYIKIKKPFDIDDRIEFKNMKGDVIAINRLDFELLEVGNNINADQSTGRVINVPNSVAITDSIINYAKDFKYVWNEITVKTPLDVDSDETKKLLYGVINSNEVVSKIPPKMRSSMDKLSIDQRIYYNKLEPIVYLRVVDSHIEFYIRYLVHPKKNRYVEDDVWSKILLLNKEGKIRLYVE